MIEAFSGAVGMAPLEKAPPKRREDAATLLTVMPAEQKKFSPTACPHASAFSPLRPTLSQVTTQANFPTSEQGDAKPLTLLRG